MARRAPSMTPRTRASARAHSASTASVHSVALFQQVKDHIARKIQDGTLRAGDRLPSEHALVAQFGISRMTAR